MHYEFPRFGFNCQGCNLDYDWTGAARMIGEYEIKTIANRFCVNCIDKEAMAHGVNRSQILVMRMCKGQAVP